MNDLLILFFNKALNIHYFGWLFIIVIAIFGGWYQSYSIKQFLKVFIYIFLGLFILILVIS